ncbi:magnesium protoporphyrin IX methyltransferase [Synechococcus sp. CBW1004]|jgi:magnesium-protoporphyrin O-methyltransferase|uniref:magnesium protoporphyrin IX methyltransferase n=1 Tax=Synechococcus sp. CBW1004 TaxID=1353136 RepID=UPI0018CFD7BF|nr:magnesium protoporphyrin IX methyltransferase [Synechococcus sp. CBW1004]QPN62086.1 magnesium protoporphyrin IX methyltransferase [Synechococcus sp. CBW1004]
MSADLQTSTTASSAATGSLDAKQAEKAAEKQEVKGYFETTGFERWKRIYSDSDDVNKVQRNIRIGHQKTVDEVLAWLQARGGLESRSFCDAGCGVGSLAIPLALAGAGSVAASDLSEAMVSEASRRAAEAGIAPERLSFHASDLESLEGRYDTVVCLDVFIHYPQQAAEEMVRHLASLAENRLIVSFAPYTPLLALLKGIGQLFPGPSKTTRAYQLREDGIVAAAAACGFRPVHRSLNQAPFYFSRLIAFERG